MKTTRHTTPGLPLIRNGTSATFSEIVNPYAFWAWMISARLVDSNCRPP